METQFVSALEEQISQLFSAADASFYDLHQRAIGAGRAAPDPLTYLRAIFTPSGSSSRLDVTSSGITKVGAHGEFILAIGVEEQLLPGKTGLGIQGRDVASRKRTVEGLMEEGRAGVERGRQVVESVAEDVAQEGERVGEEFDAKAREEEWANGWKSDAFDL